MNLIEQVHENYVYNRRIRMLSRHLSEYIPKDARVLDVGCGDGLLARRISEARDDVFIRGLDVSVRRRTYITVNLFDGSTIPYDDGSVDLVMFVDVLHHTEDPMVLLREAARVARKNIVIKDHLLDRVLAGPTLRLMDRIGNARHGVSLPYNYWPERTWSHAFETLGLTVTVWKKDLNLYPKVVDLVFGGSLHFIAQLDVNPSSRNHPYTEPWANGPSRYV